MKLVLIVDDEHGHSHILRLLLEAEGYRIAVAANGHEALISMAGERPAIILSDFMMPRMNGGELGAALRSDARLRDIPFVMMSGTTENVVRREFRDYDVFLRKPYDVWALLAIVEQLAHGGRPTFAARELEPDAPSRRLLKGAKLSPESG